MFDYRNCKVSAEAFEEYGDQLPPQTIEMCKSSDAILFGAVGGPVDEINDPKWKDAEKKVVLGLRKTFDLFSNMRPIAAKTADFIIVRELVSGIYFGEHIEPKYKGLFEDVCAKDVMSYSVSEIERVARVAFKIAMKRKKQLICVDKANVLSTSRLWRRVVKDVAKDFKEVSCDYMLVDNAAMQIVRYPEQFDVIVTGNMFGDILSDMASALVGSLGLMPSASVNGEGFGMYEPIHGSAQDIAGKGIANPIGMILSAAMMLEMSFNMKDESDAIKQAVKNTLDSGFATKDIADENSRLVKTKEITDIICKHI